MKAIVCTGYGPPEVLQLREVKKPAPRKNEVLIKIVATAVTASDGIVRGARIPVWHPMGMIMRVVVGFTKPRQPILGLVLAGDVEAAGKDVTRFRVGDPVFAFTAFRFGAYAEYLCLPENGLLAIKPANVNYEEAAALPYGGLIAMDYLRKGNVRSGQKVMIYGASGANGTAAVQIARSLGAEVTGVCSTTNLELVKSLGADRVIDYTSEPVANWGERYDFIFDSVGKRKSENFPLATLVAANGKYISVDDGSPHPRLDDLGRLKELVEAGKVRPVIDRRFPLEQMVAAHRYVDQGHKKGNVVINVGHTDG